MKTVVFAYHDMGCLGIEALLAAGYEISAIFTHTDNPGEKAFYGSVARLAAERGIPVYAPDDVNHPLWVERIAQLSPDVIFSFYYRHLICDEILGNDSNLLIVFYVQIMPDDFVMQLHRF